MKKWMAILLTAALLLSLTGCSSTPDPNCGVYEARKASASGVSVDMEKAFAGGFSVELKSGEKAMLHVNGEDYNLKWELDGVTFHLIAADTEFYGTLKDGVMYLPDFQDSGMDVTLVCDALVSDASSTDAPRTASEYSEYWDGLWYGWRIDYSAWGEDEGYEDQAFDVLAEIAVDGDKGTIKVWDREDEEQELLINGDVTFGSGLTDAGKMTITGGTVFNGEVPEEGIEVEPGDSTVSSLDHMIEIYGIFVRDEESGFEYYFFLRPWGMDWEDVKDAESEDFPYADMMPVSYDDWYLPEIQ